MRDCHTFYWHTLTLSSAFSRAAGAPPTLLLAGPVGGDGGVACELAAAPNSDENARAVMGAPGRVEAAVVLPFMPAVLLPGPSAAGAGVATGESSERCRSKRWLFVGGGESSALPRAAAGEPAAVTTLGLTSVTALLAGPGLAAVAVVGIEPAGGGGPDGSGGTKGCDLDDDCFGSVGA